MSHRFPAGFTTELVAEQLEVKADSKLIIFTQFRDTVETTVENLNHIEGVSAVRFVGQATRIVQDAGLKQKEQLRILEDFRSGRYNVLVTTSIGEESCDVEGEESLCSTTSNHSSTQRRLPQQTTVLDHRPYRDLADRLYESG